MRYHGAERGAVLGLLGLVVDPERHGQVLGRISGEWVEGKEGGSRLRGGLRRAIPHNLGPERPTDEVVGEGVSSLVKIRPLWRDAVGSAAAEEAWEKFARGVFMEALRGEPPIYPRF